MTKYFITLWIALGVGCSSIPGGRVTHSLHTREAVLSRQHPQNDFLGAKLIAIADNGTTTIEVISTGDRLRAAPGEYFAPGPYGTQGLRLVSASAEKQEARLSRTWCETK